MSIETHAYLSGDYEATLAEVERFAHAWREERKAARQRKNRMNKVISDYVSTRKEPDFFCKPGDAAFERVHEEIQHSIETATEIMNFDLDPELIKRAEAKLATIGWTLEKACILFLFWCINCPDKAETWVKAHESRGEPSCSTSPEAPTESSVASNDSVKG